MLRNLTTIIILSPMRTTKFRADAPDEMQKTAMVIIIFHRVVVECLCTVFSMRRSFPENADLNITPILENLGILYVLIDWQPHYG